MKVSRNIDSTMRNAGINLVFSVVMAVLGIVSAVSMYAGRARPVIREAPQPVSEMETQLPENHPPIDISNQLRSLEEMSRSEPGNAAHRIQIGNIYYDMGQYRKAIDAYETALKLKPRDAGVETDLATCYYSIGQSDEALRILDRVLQYQPNFPMAMFNKGIVLQSARNDATGAIAVWEALLRANPDFHQRADLEQRIAQLKVAK
jgi:cytochrome c-type biogenesis protein CcmH/NrfG